MFELQKADWEPTQRAGIQLECIHSACTNLVYVATLWIHYCAGTIMHRPMCTPTIVLTPQHTYILRNNSPTIIRKTLYVYMQNSALANTKLW